MDGEHGAVARAIRGLVASALAVADLAVPLSCPCGREGVRLCAACRGLLAPAPVRVDAACPALQIVVAADASRGESGVIAAPLLPVLALGEHVGGLRRLVLAWKNGGMLCLAQPLGEHLTPGVGMLGAGREVALVPIPSSLAHRIRRGEDHTAELARAVARRSGTRVVPALSLRGGSQSGKGRRERREDRWDQMRTTRAAATLRRGSGAGVILVDDVVTTGATLRAAHAALEGDGVQVLGAIVVSSARMPRSPTVPGAMLGCGKL